MPGISDRTECSGALPTICIIIIIKGSSAVTSLGRRCQMLMPIVYYDYCNGNRFGFFGRANRFRPLFNVPIQLYFVEVNFHRWTKFISTQIISNRKQCYVKIEIKERFFLSVLCFDWLIYLIILLNIFRFTFMDCLSFDFGIRKKMLNNMTEEKWKITMMLPVTHWTHAT